MKNFDLGKRLTDSRLKDFADYLMAYQRRMSFKVSARGWCYLMENERVINKDQFDKVEGAINRARRRGYLPIDFVAEEDARAFKGVEEPTEGGEGSILKWMLRDVLNGSKYFTPNWWEGEKYYIQMVVEKIDLVSLFRPVCMEYHVPVANSKGWSSMLQRAEYARRFKEAEDKGLKCVLLYCGDHDPDGLRISDTLRKNLRDLRNVVWSDGENGYDPADLVIDRFGLNFELIERLGLMWIDNLTTGSGRNLASPSHPNHGLDYVQDYLRDVGVRKCEANAILPYQEEAEILARDAIEGYVGEGAVDRFKKKRELADENYEALLEETGLRVAIDEAMEEL